MLNFKGWSAQWMAMAANLVPELRTEVEAKLQSSAVAIGTSCVGESDGMSDLCGSRWWGAKWDGIKGLEVQQAALGGITANLMLLSSAETKTIETNPDAEEKYLDTSDDDIEELKPISTGDRVGSWILTVLWGTGIVAAGWWLIKQA